MMIKGTTILHPKEKQINHSVVLCMVKVGQFGDE